MLPTNYSLKKIIYKHYLVSNNIEWLISYWTQPTNYHILLDQDFGNRQYIIAGFDIYESININQSTSLQGWLVGFIV